MCVYMYSYILTHMYSGREYVHAGGDVWPRLL